MLSGPERGRERYPPKVRRVSDSEPKEDANELPKEARSFGTHGKDGVRKRIAGENITEKV